MELWYSTSINDTQSFIIYWYYIYMETMGVKSELCVKCLTPHPYTNPLPACHCAYKCHLIKLSLIPLNSEVYSTLLIGYPFASDRIRLYIHQHDACVLQCSPRDFCMP